MITVLLCSCRMEHFKRRDVVEWAKENFSEPVRISAFYEERQAYDSEYTDHVWTAYLRSNPEIEFEIISHQFYGMEWIDFRIESTFSYRYGEFYFKEYLKDHDSLFAPSDSSNITGIYWLRGRFTSRDQIPEVTAEVEKIGRFFEEKGYPDVIRFAVSYDDPLALGVATTSVTDSLDYSPGCAEESAQELTEKMKLYAVEYQLATDQFSKEELEQAVSDAQRPYVIIRADGSTVSYPDLLLKQYGGDMSFGMLYEVLTREGFDTEGTSDAFTVTGVDGSVYTFSYWFNDYPFYLGNYEAEPQGGYYYLKDGEKVPMPNYHVKHITSAFFEEISGMRFEEIE